MANSLMKDIHGPDWPLGFIKVVTPGTPVAISSLIDPTDINEPDTPLQPTQNPIVTSGQQEYTYIAQQLIFQAFKPGATHGLQLNTGNIYIVREGDGTGSANRDDYGDIIAVLTPGQSFFLGSSARVRNTFSLYRYFLDADNANDGAIVTAIIQ